MTSKAFSTPSLLASRARHLFSYLCLSLRWVSAKASRQVEHYFLTFSSAPTGRVYVGYLIVRDGMLVGTR